MTRDGAISPELTRLLNEALARELQVSIQYMLQHTVAEGQGVGNPDKDQSPQALFIASNAWIYWPGKSLKRIAIAEMRHAEAVAERITVLGGEPVTQADPFTLGNSPREMLENDREQERSAIELYRRIIDRAGAEQDEVTVRLFRRILSEEEKHHQIFSELLQAG